MPVHLQHKYTVQSSQPFSALSYSIPRPSTSSAKASSSSSMMIAGSTSASFRKPEYITKDYYSSALSRFSTYSTDDSDSDSDSGSDSHGSSDEFCFDDLESSSPRSSTLSPRATTSSNLTSPLLCTCDKRDTNKPTLTVGDFVFGSQAEYDDYNDLVRSQTRNAAKRRASSTLQTSLPSSYSSTSSRENIRGRRRQRHLHKLEEQEGDSAASDSRDLPEANSVPEHAHSQLTSTDYTSSFEPALLAAKLEALLVTSPSYSPSFTSTESLPSLYLDSEGDEYETDEETDVEEAYQLTKVNAPSPRKEVLPEAAESRFERALAFANWSKRGRAGVWESPEGISDTVRELVASIEGAQ